MKLQLLLLLLCIWIGNAYAQNFDFSNLSDQREFDQEIEKTLARTKVPGVSVAIIENDQVVYAKGYGISDLGSGNAVNDSTLFQLCSLSKIYLLHAVMQLVDKDIVDLDVHAYTILPHDRLLHDERHKDITLRMLLNHTSGIENWQSHNDKDVLEIRSDPGKNFVYSGEGYNYLADIVDQILGTPYESYIDTLVTKPLGVSARTIYYTDTLQAFQNYAVGHSISGRPLVKAASFQLLPSSSVLNDAASFARMTVSLFSTDYLSSEAMDYIQEKEIDLASMGDMNWYWGNGLAVSEGPQEKILHFGGSNSGFKSYVAYSPISRKGFVYLTNSDVGDVFAERLNGLVTKWGWLFKTGYYFEILPVEMYLLVRDLYLARGEEEFLDGLMIERGDERGSVNRVGRNWIMIFFNSIFMLVCIGLMLWALMQLIPGIKNRLRPYYETLSTLTKYLLGWGGLLFLLVWFILLLISSSSEAIGLGRYASVIKVILMTGFFMQLFWFSAVRRLIVLRLLVAGILCFLVYFQSALTFADLELVRSRLYRPENFYSYYYLDYLIGLAIASVSIIVAYRYMKSSKDVIQASV